MRNNDEWLRSSREDVPRHVQGRAKRSAYRRSVTTSNLFNALGVLMVLAASAYLLNKHFSFDQVLGMPAASNPELLPTPDPAEFKPPVHLEPIQQSNTASLPAKPKPLDDCLKEGNVIDEGVIRCRYGELPRAAGEPVESSGMVSAEYMQEFQNSRSVTKTPSVNNNIEHVTQWVDQWGGGAKYLAQWSVLNNRIDGTSVCANHRRGSIEYRECRKGAKQFYKQQCRAWEERWDQDRQDGSKRMQQRYCSAANGFSPMG